MRKRSLVFVIALLSATTALAEDGPRIMEIPTVFEPVPPRSPTALSLPLPAGGSNAIRESYMLLRQGAY